MGNVAQANRPIGSAPPFGTDAACYKRQIDHPTDPSRNHPIHDAVEVIEYGDGRWIVSLSLDGVSETKDQKKLVPIGRTLCWGFSKFCTEAAPEKMKDIVGWFRQTTRDPHYANQGSTTISLIRFDRITGIIDGINLGDSVPLMIVQNPVAGPDGPRHTQFRAVVLAPLHTVANDPGSVFKCWRHGVAFEPDGFRLALPRKYAAVWLVTMSDGFVKVQENVANRLYDSRVLERILAKRYPDFVRVFLPEPLIHLAPELRRPTHGRVRFSLIKDNAPLKQAFTEYYKGPASPEERKAMEVVDLDTTFLQTLLSAKDDADREILGKTVEQHQKDAHRTLRWLFKAPANPRAGDRGFESYLRVYCRSELFGEAMVHFIDRNADSGISLSRRLRAFMEGLGQIGDDFCVALIRLSANTGPPPMPPPR